MQTTPLPNFAFMRTVLSFILFAGLMLAAQAQLSVAYHQSSLPFAEVQVEIFDRLVPALRLGTNLNFDSFSPELVVTFQYLKQPDYEAYAGLGVRANAFEGLVVPAGINLFPFEQKKFGFHIELAALMGESEVLRGSWGIRYRFGGG